MRQNRLRYSANNVKRINDNPPYAVDFLLTQGASANSKTTNGTTALMIAAIIGNLKMIESLLKNGANINAVNNKGTTVLMTAAGSGKIEAVDLLLAKGAHPCLKDINGKTALQTAFDWWGRSVVLKVLEKYPNSKALFCNKGAQ